MGTTLLVVLADVASILHLGKFVVKAELSRLEHQVDFFALILVPEYSEREARLMTGSFGARDYQLCDLGQQPLPAYFFIVDKSN